MMEELALCRKQQEAYRRQYQAVEQEKCDAMNTLLERQRKADVEKEREKQRQAKQVGIVRITIINYSLKLKVRFSKGKYSFT